MLNDRLKGREYIVADFTIADMSAWGWVDRASRVFKSSEDLLGPYPELKRWFAMTNARAPSNVRAP
ncbi:glutathione S-transferase C-terminal domain-containing protein [Caballeronia cordobensis]|uniref:glutathione S-transferase C-terminal domain-containing protein n=1 Tax=Caballeronia cordobensis TaxID=1353886 RepID=UPI000A62279A|nr:glutathione S-transferase C-terminal domain-containing protein [Caballeronia cordobensis]